MKLVLILALALALSISISAADGPYEPVVPCDDDGDPFIDEY